ncbi:MAG TPA: hypothetical protein VFW07_16865 [Parafilimonas sp.]|nr:hypothetical protein [Parafilimonas sp.]
MGNQINTTMTESSFIAMAQKRYAQLQSLSKIDSFYDYEKEFDKIWKDLGKEVLEASISKLPADRRKKNSIKVWENQHK